MIRESRLLLHWSPRSPYVRKVLIAAHEAGLEDRIDTTRTVVGGTTPHLELMEDNPLGKLPTLIPADGRAIYDSYVILEYFHQLSPKAGLIPEGGPARIETLRHHALGNGMLDILLQWLGERGRPPERQSEPHIALWRSKITACITTLESEADTLAATKFNIGHIAIGTALGYLDFRFKSDHWRPGHDRLAAWYETFRLRPSVVAHPPVDDS
jgi:glutathione S-transferase